MVGKAEHVGYIGDVGKRVAVGCMRCNTPCEGNERECCGRTGGENMWTEMSACDGGVSGGPLHVGEWVKVVDCG